MSRFHLWKIARCNNLLTLTNLKAKISIFAKGSDLQNYTYFTIIEEYLDFRNLIHYWIVEI